MDTKQTTVMKQNLPFSFSGNAIEYFKIYIVNIFLTIITLGIYSAWAKVRNNRYLYGNTQLDSNRFLYHADPIKILKGRIIAVFFVIAYTFSVEFYPAAGLALLGVGLFLFPYILVTATSFQMRNTSYRNVRFFFNRDYSGAYKLLGLPLAIVFLLTMAMYFAFDTSWVDMQESLQVEGEEEVEVTKGDFIFIFFMLAVLPIIPYLDFLKSRFILNNTQYGKLEASFSGNVWGFYWLYIKVMLLFILILVLVSGLFAGLAFVVSMGENGPASEAEINHFIANPVMILSIIVVFYSLGFLVSAYLRAKRTNMIFNRTQVEDLQIVSSLKTLPVFWIYLTNIIMIILSAGLMIPWAKIRMCRYVASCTEIEADSLEAIQSVQEQERNALGEEMADAFDMEIGL